MHVHWIDQYRPGSSPVHRLDARVKLSLVILYVLVTSLLPAGAWLAFAMLLALPLGAALFAEIGLTGS
jgi:energy-coupling factor transporter transmembrane protein EcfT